jgi:hypothetical protein
LGPLNYGVLGSGTGNQPFKNSKDYQNWLKISYFLKSADTAISNFAIGIASETILPKFW